jgi:hypothetical protein
MDWKTNPNEITFVCPKAEKRWRGYIKQHEKQLAARAPYAENYTRWKAAKTDEEREACRVERAEIKARLDAPRLEAERLARERWLARFQIGPGHA